MREVTAVVFFSVLSVLMSIAGSHPGDDGAGPRVALDEYLSFAKYPHPRPVDPGLFATDIVAFWSNNTEHYGRDAVAKATEVSMREVADHLKSFTLSATNVTVHRQGDLAWLTCRIHSKGILKDGDAPYQRTIRSTFLFEKRAGRWQMVHEHSSHPPDKLP